jgi:hypothetical protein
VILDPIYINQNVTKEVSSEAPDAPLATDDGESSKRAVPAADPVGLF